MIHLLRKDWTPVALPLGDVALEKVEINGQPATLAAGKPEIYLESVGLHVVDVRFSVPVSRLGATGHMTVPLRPAASGRLLFQLPAKDLDVQVSGSPGGWRSRRPTLRARRTIRHSISCRPSGGEQDRIPKKPSDATSTRSSS